MKAKEIKETAGQKTTLDANLVELFQDIPLLSSAQQQDKILEITKPFGAQTDIDNIRDFSKFKGIKGPVSLEMIGKEEEQTVNTISLQQNPIENSSVLPQQTLVLVEKNEPALLGDKETNLDQE